MIDDMIDTGGTIVEGATALKNLGGEDITIIATHGIFSGPAIERLAKAKEAGIIGTIAVTDTLQLPAHTPEGLIDTISVAPLVGEAIRNVFYDQSVSNGYER
jgi:ribose-phosphate pyrophosphokinase